MLLTLGLALLLDRFVGEWPNRLHPVVWMGSAIRWCTDRAPARGQLAYGIAIALGIPGAFAAAAWVLVQVPYASVVLGACLLKSCFAVRALGEAGRDMQQALARGDLERARHGLRSLCSRDPSALGPRELAAGTVESLAENASDSVVAPLFWFAVAGVPGAVFYRATNTLDSMIGYHGKYEWLGKASARLDDVLNFVPARITALLLLLGGAVTGGDLHAGWRVMRRDAGKTESPNAGWPMAAMAGLLGVELEKAGCYRLGEGGAPDALAIGRAWGVVVGGLLVAAPPMVCLALVR
ncbi:MAG: adenosylcobinamide-phosphate synthase CbiB [Myxococcota bacterium]